jgi:hypothetical protein
MELLPGETLRALLKREGAQRFERVLSFAGDVASALVAAHGEGIIHRDLKPENVMLVKPVGRPETCKVLDFGVAKRVQARATARVRGLSLAAQALANAHMQRRDDTLADVKAYEEQEADVPFLGNAVKANGALLSGDFAGAARIVESGSCYDRITLAMVQSVWAAADPAQAEAHLSAAEQALAPFSSDAGRALCSFGDVVLSDVGNLIVADATVLAAEVAARRRQKATARELLARVRDLYRDSDADIGWRCHAHAVEHCLETGESCVLTGGTKQDGQRHTWPYCDVTPKAPP